MLDQNTDRMWFVIGAVIVGAAIIFIANGTMPEIFANVTDIFEDSAHKATDVIEEIGWSNVPGEQLNRSTMWEQGGIHTHGELYATTYRLRSHPIAISSGAYELVTDIVNGLDYKLVVQGFDGAGNHIERLGGGDSAVSFTVPDTVSHVRLEISYRNADEDAQVIEDSMRVSDIGDNILFELVER